jgi:hypothetical protein
MLKGIVNHESSRMESFWKILDLLDECQKNQSVVERPLKRFLEKPLCTHPRGGVPETPVRRDR